MTDDADFNVEPLRRVAAELLGHAGATERVVLLADRPDYSVPYALELSIPAEGQPGRDRGLQLLFARLVTVAAAVVGSSKLRVVCHSDSTLEHITGELAAHPGVTANLSQYGPLSVTRATEEAVPAALRTLPFQRRAAVEPRGRPCGVPPGGRVFLGVDFGRSDVKAAVLAGDGAVLATHVTRWWRPAAGPEGGGAREYVDPAVLKDHGQHLACLAGAAISALEQATSKPTAEATSPPPPAVAWESLGNDTDDLMESCVRWQEKVVCGFGLSAAGCVRGGRLCGVPPAMGGVDPDLARADLGALEARMLDLVRQRFPVDPGCPAVLVNDGDASALYGAKGLGSSDRAGLFLSCGTGLAGGIVWRSQCCEGVLELGKLVLGLRRSEGGVVPRHDGLAVEGVAQGMAGTQRSFFNLLAARGGALVEGKAEQRAALVAMQKGPLDENVRGIFTSLGTWLANFVLELNDYLPRPVEYVEAGGKLTDGPSGQLMLDTCHALLRDHGVSEVRKADDSEFGQAIAMAELVRVKT